MAQWSSVAYHWKTHLICLKQTQHNTIYVTRVVIYILLLLSVSKYSWKFVFVPCLVSRALGIPCRVITNYLSAHDTNSNLVIERYINENGEPIQSRDMIWYELIGFMNVKLE